MTATAAVSARASRKYDVLVWGATGFTGRLVAEYLTLHYGVGRELRWALGGRNRAKLEGVRSDLAAIDPRARDLAIIVGDNSDRAALDAIVRDARVVATTVGPYAIHGRELVAACAAQATDYCDLTGETPFIRDSIDANHARARETGARIVHCCGYDSIPSDLGVLVLQEHMRKEHGAPCAQVKYFAGESKGGISGGTIASMLNLVEQVSRDRRVRRIATDPYALDPDRGAPGPDGPDQRGVKWDDDLKRWTGPFVMAAINTRVVRRTNALLGYAYGRDFRYSEAMSFPQGPKGWIAATATTVGIGGFLAAVSVPPLRKLLASTVLPSPGEGPSKETRDAGFFTSRLVGIGAAKRGAGDGAGAGTESVTKLLGTVKGTSDPGYGETAKMLSESAVCLAKDGDAITREGGVLTPASCMGMRLVERLRQAGMTFGVEEMG